jgi:hypothetical protein
MFIQRARTKISFVCDTTMHLNGDLQLWLNTIGILTVQIKEYFCELIGSTIEASVRSVRAFVKQYLVRTTHGAS